MDTELIKIQIKNIASINAQSISRDFEYESILYLDTSSITRNIISALQNINILEAPSRAQRRVKDNTIIYSTVRPNLEHFGLIENPPENMIVSTGFVTIDIHSESVDRKYLYYLLTRPDITKRLSQIAETNTSAYPSLNPSDIGNLTFCVPKDINIQQKIASVLSVLDKKIELNNKIIKELEAMSKELYDYWFVQFDFPDANGKPYRSSGGAMTYNSTLKRDIPLGWEVKTLLDIATYTNGLACQKFRPEINEEALRVIKIKEMHNGFSEETEFVKTAIPEKVKVHNGDILFSWSASLEVMLWAYGEGGLNQHIFKVTSDKYPRGYYYYQLLDYVEHFQKIAEARKTTMGHITQEHLQQSRIVIPKDDTLINAYEKMVKSMFDKVIYLNQENQGLTTQRDWLLPMLMNGQVTVK